MLAAAAVITAGCAILAGPSGPRQFGGFTQQGTDQGAAYPQLIAVPPGQGWSAEQIVFGFIAASASFANGHAVAREYLDPAVARVWDPGSAVTVVAGQPRVTEVNAYHQGLAGGGSTLVSKVRVTGQPFSTLTSKGQLLPPSSSQLVSEDFQLADEKGQWRITRPPLRLLLTRQAFLQVYQPRNLYFFSPAGDLVPDPVFVPEQATETALVIDLVQALLPPSPPKGSWLWLAVHAAFPAGTRLSGVEIDGTQATVNLGGSASQASWFVRQRMAAQLVWTLTSPSYGVPPIQSVVLEINGRPQLIHGKTDQLLASYQELVLAQSAPQDLYFVDAEGVLLRMPSGGKARPLPGAVGARHAGFSAIAVSPNGTALAGIAPSAQGCLVETAPLTGHASFTQHPLGGSSCTSLSWSSSGDLWVAAGRVIWMLPPGTHPRPLNTGLPRGDSVTVFRLAPDGTRAAMLVRNRSGTQLLLGSIAGTGFSATLQETAAVGPGIADPVDVSWHGPDYLIVLSGAGAGSQLTNVPLDSEPGTLVPVPPGPIDAMSANGGAITVEQGGNLLTLASQQQTWQAVGPGSIPAYQG